MEEQAQIDARFDQYQIEYNNEPCDEEDCYYDEEVTDGMKAGFVIDSKYRPRPNDDEEEKEEDFEVIGKDKTMIRTLAPSSDQLASLDLTPGENLITFTVSSRLQGEQKVSGRIFLWDYRTKIVISDVDGTITRSDVMGHVMPRFGNDWSHSGICDLF